MLNPQRRRRSEAGFPRTHDGSANGSRRADPADFGIGSPLTHYVKCVAESGVRAGTVSDGLAPLNGFLRIFPPVTQQSSMFKSSESSTQSYIAREKTYANLILDHSGDSRAVTVRCAVTLESGRSD